MPPNSRSLEAGASRCRSIPSIDNLWKTKGGVRSLMIRRLLPLAMAWGLAAPSIELCAFVAAPKAVAQSSVVLKLRRLGDRVDVVIDGMSADARVVSQSSSLTQWSGQLRSAAPLFLRRFQDVQLPDAGLQSIRLSAQGEGGLELVVKAIQGMALPDPQIRVDGNSLIISFARLPIQTMALTSGRLDLRRPGRVDQPNYVPPLQSRATAPPLGDIAVGSIVVTSNNLINISGPLVSLVLNNAPAKDALMSLARIGGFGFVYVNPPQTDLSEAPKAVRSVSLAFKNEPFGRALNSVLLSSGLEARLDGRTLLVGEDLNGSNFAPKVSKVFRLNQVQPDAAANYLTSLGATMSRVLEETTTTGEPASAGTSDLSTQVSQITSKRNFVETLEASDGPLMGLVGTTDNRLGTITVVGEPRLISLAESYLKQIDLRKRQVAVKVQIISVALDNNKTIDSSFSSRIGNTFLVSESGNAHINFGDYKPGGSAEGAGVYDGFGYLKPGTYSQPPGQVQKELNGNPVFDKNGRPVYIDSSELYRQPRNSFYGYLDAQIESGSAKVLTEPTLLIGESEQSEVNVGLEVVTKIKTGCETEKGNAGLSLLVNVSKIDDNGFVTLSINPALNSPVLAGSVCGVDFFNIDKREMVANNIRLRDRQTLVASGVISELQEEITTKWPLLGDLPLLGSFFRETVSRRQKEELVILVTPQIIDDQRGGFYGYGYYPSTQGVKEVLWAY